MNKKDIQHLTEAYEVVEKAPPGERAERMVKHIKSSAEESGKSEKEAREIAFATAWKHHNKEKNLNEHHGDDFPEEILNQQITIGQLLDDLQPYLSMKETYDKLEKWIVHHYGAGSEGKFFNVYEDDPQHMEEASKCPVTGKMRKKKKSGY